MCTLPPPERDPTMHRGSDYFAIGDRVKLTREALGTWPDRTSIGTVTGFNPVPHNPRGLETVIAPGITDTGFHPSYLIRVDSEGRTLGRWPGATDRDSWPH